MDDIPTKNTAPTVDADLIARPEKPLWVVGVGAGAGGLEALQLLFGALPADSGLAFVICRRMQSGLSDPLADLLRTQTTMPVFQADHGTKLEGGCVYLIAPEARMVLLKDRLLTFVPNDDAERSASPVDILLHSIAASAGPTAIAVILSGKDEDGLRGCASVREFGGLVLAQHPETTEFADMPRRVIDADLASAVATPGAIADQIRRHVGKTRKAADRPSEGPRDDDALARITALLEARFAIDAHAYRPSLVAKRVRRRLGISKAANLSDYADFLAGNDEELSALHDDILIRVTAFFRDPEAFVILAEQVVPKLVENMTAHRPIRVWVPACASGEEAYSIAMLILDRIEKVGRKAELEVLASDRHIAAIKQARTGCYLRESLGNMPAGLMTRYMREDVHYIEAGPRLRRHVTFIDHDILKAPPPDDIDLVSCRNLLIYLAAASCEKALQACSEALKPGGFLFLGPSEQPSQQMTDLAAVDGKWRIYQKAALPPVDETTSQLVVSHKRKSVETIPIRKTSLPADTSEIRPEPPAPRTESPQELESVMVENQRMLESTIDTLLASNAKLRRRNRDLRADNQRLGHAHAALDDVATMIAHDLKAPLQYVDRLSRRLEGAFADTTPNADAAGWLQAIQHQTLALTRLIEDLLVYARQGTAHDADLQSVRIPDLLRETLALVGLPKGVKVLIRPRHLEVMTWQIPLACILRNLLTQAIERIGDAAGTIQIEALPTQGFVEITVADNGRQACGRSSQLGTAIIRQLLDSAGGRMTSSTETSTRNHHVRMTWPVADAAATKATADKSP